MSVNCYYFVYFNLFRYNDTGFTVNGVEYEGSLLCVGNLLMSWKPKKFSEITADRFACSMFYVPCLFFLIFVSNTFIQISIYAFSCSSKPLYMNEAVVFYRFFYSLCLSWNWSVTPKVEEWSVNCAALLNQIQGFQFTFEVWRKIEEKNWTYINS